MQFILPVEIVHEIIFHCELSDWPTIAEVFPDLDWGFIARQLFVRLEKTEILKHCIHQDNPFLFDLLVTHCGIDPYADNNSALFGAAISDSVGMIQLLLSKYSEQYLIFNIEHAIDLARRYKNKAAMSILLQHLGREEEDEQSDDEWQKGWAKLLQIEKK